MGWRLPTIAEAMTLLDGHRSPQQAPVTWRGGMAFPALGANWQTAHWTSTVYVDGASHTPRAWGASLEMLSYTPNQPQYVVCTRDID